MSERERKIGNWVSCDIITGKEVGKVKENRGRLI